MSKKKGILFFIISIIVILLCCFTAVFGFGKGKVGSAKNITLGLDLRGGVSITYEVQDKEFTQTDMDDTIYKLQLRVAEYSADASVYQEGTDRITVEIPGVYDTQTVIEELGRPGSLQFITYDAKNEDGTVDYTQPTVWVTGADVVNAQAGTQSNQTTGSSDFVVQLQLGDEGAEKFAEATTSHVGDIIYIVYDGEVVSYPRVQSAITGGNCVIEGMGSYEAASTLASTIRIGSLNLELEEISSKVVSAKLGDNAVSTSLIAGAIGILLIMIFMIIFYRIPGLAAAISMVFYTAAILLLLNAFNLTLTISGIAGIILSIGMAVDGNVIINARIKEELVAGRSTHEAIRFGFKRSLSAILDGNITTLIVAIVLLIFGSGSVKGFGMTLAIGIVLSVITSLFVSRLLVYCLYAMGLKAPKFYASVKNTKKKVFDFVGKRVIWFVIAAALIVAGVATLVINSATGKRAFNYNIEFIGGVSTQVEFDKDYSIDEFNDTMKADISAIINSNDIEGQKVTGTTQYVIKTQDIEASVRQEMQDMLVEKYGADAESFETTYISSSVSKELLRDAYISLLIAAVCMLLYIWIRFRKFKFAISSVIALLHDVLIVVAFFAIFRLSVGNSFIACILTIVGYSINATIVIFDRIRENLKNQAINFDLKKVINTSVQQSLSRSIFTSATTFVMVLFLYILGVESMRAFAMPLAVGIVAGAFSSIFISGALYFIMTKKSDRLDENRAEKAAKLYGTEDSIAQVAADGTAVITETAEDAEDAAEAPVKITANPNRKKKKKRKQ
ncbi:MAG: protein translocase subunit SecD [Lachnospiraceae bacterium]|nr:protein translocase subunit SecD [Lachnospiraceae bacterium]